MALPIGVAVRMLICSLLAVTVNAYECTLNSSTGDSALAPQLDPINNLCYLFFQQSTIKNNSLYIDGGQETFVDLTFGQDECYRNWSSTKTRGYNYRLLKLDLSQPWDWHDHPMPYVAIDKSVNKDFNAYPPLVGNGALYQGRDDDPRLYLFGGTTSYWNTTFVGFEPPPSAEYSLWSFDTNTEQWYPYDISSASPIRPSYGLQAEAPDLGLAFYFNGQLDSGSSSDSQTLGSDVKIFVPGMIVVNTTDQSAVNVSTTAVSGTEPRTRGGAAYIPSIGGNGIVTFFGGTYKPTTQLDDMQKGNFVPLSEIDILDINAYLRNDTSKLWYKQTATGDIPPPRNSFCSVMVSAPDNSSHNIYLHSGQGMAGVIYDDVYVLSIPSFTWTKLNTGIRTRYGHTCHLVGDQMLRVGGLSDSDSLNSTCDLAYQGVAVYNLTSTYWVHGFTPAEDTPPYVVPDGVKAAITSLSDLHTVWVGTSWLTLHRRSNGSAPMIRPPGGWTDPTLGAVFGEKVEMPSQRDKSFSAGAIAGIVIGGVALIAGSLVGVWFWRRRQKRNRAKAAKTASSIAPSSGPDIQLGTFRPPDRRQDEALPGMTSAQTNP